MGCCIGAAKVPGRGGPGVDGDKAETQASSIYDLGEDEQLSLAIQRSLNEESQTTSAARSAEKDGNPEYSNCPADVVAVDHAGGSDLQPEVTPAPQGSAPQEVAGGDGGGGPPRPVVPAQISVSHGPAGDPEWTAAPQDARCMPADLAAGGTTAARGTHAGSTTGRQPGSSSSGQRAVIESSTVVPSSKLPAAVDAAVHHALELAKVKQFAEAENCLKQICNKFPEHKEAREFTSAWDAVTLCRQFHAKA